MTAGRWHASGRYGGRAPATCEVIELFRTPWLMSPSTDRRYPTTTHAARDDEPVSTQIANMVTAAVTDAAAYHRCSRVMHMLNPLSRPDHVTPEDRRHKHVELDKAADH